MTSTSNVFYRDLNKNYPIASRGEGIYIYDSNKKKYLDGSSGALVANVGHGQKEIFDSMYEQMKSISFAHTSQFRTIVLEEYASKLSKITPGEIKYSYFVSGGSEALDTAIKMSRQYQLERGRSSKYKIIARWTSFHGHTLGALSVGGYAEWRRPQEPNLIPVHHINPPNCFRCPLSLEYPSCQVKCALELEEMILREGPETISAFVFEPIIGSSASAVIAPSEYFKVVSEICKKYDILMIADEVMSGFGRTGEYFACNHWGIKPDIIISAKGISGGYAPLGAVLVHEKIYKAFKSGSGRFVHGFTHSGNPVSVSAGLATLKFIIKHDLLNNVKKLSSYLEGELKRLADEFSIIGDVRGKGFMWGLELVSDNKEMSFFDPELKVTNNLVKICFENGLIVYPSQKFHYGVYGDSIMIAPPIIISKDEIDELISLLRKSLTQLINYKITG
ncbi:aspartate aminotransferase family protein [Virgibacillus byunsanensis]|uniref:Aspartate aminotransferase family protein n=1 Tax=Virgibacillus byunsanensis TaxID=570945 RepID=A0ABW3LPK2_9BACI